MLIVQSSGRESSVLSGCWSHLVRIRVTHLRGVAASYLLQDGLPLLAVGDRGQLHVSHLLHLLVHVYLLLQLADFGAQQAHGVVPVVLPGQSGGAGRVDRRDPVLQLRLTRGLAGTEEIESRILFQTQKIKLGNVKKGE